MLPMKASWTRLDVAFILKAVLVGSVLLVVSKVAVLTKIEKALTVPEFQSASPDRFVNQTFDQTDKDDYHFVFHLMHTNEAALFGELQFRTIESIFFHHPKDKVILHSRELPLSRFQSLLDLGYDIVVRSGKDDTATSKLLRLQEDPHFFSTGQGARPSYSQVKEVIQDFIPRMDTFPHDGTNHWPAHHADLQRMLILYFEGGTYLDTDMIVVQSLHSLPWNTLGYEDKGERLNQAVMKFEPYHEFMRECLWEFLTTFDNTKWGHNGPELVTRVHRRREEERLQLELQEINGMVVPPPQRRFASLPPPIHTMHKRAFYYFHWRTVAKDCFQHTKVDKVERRIRAIARNETYLVHWNYHRTVGIPIKEGTACHCLFHSFCLVSNCSAALSDPKQREQCAPLLDAPSRESAETQ